MTHYLEKVTAFITRSTTQGEELLLFQHPFAGNQIPAGTVELHETPEAAVLREVTEETGLTTGEGETAVSLPPRYLTYQDEPIPPDQCAITVPTKVYARPDTASFDWAYLRRGLTVYVRRQVEGFLQVEYIEHNKVPDPEYITMSILGWVPEETTATLRRRYFFHLTCITDTLDRWQTNSDNHTFTLFWAPLHQLPPIISPQDQWLARLPGVLDRQYRK